MFDRYNEQSGGDNFRKALFGGAGRRNMGWPQAVPAMERVVPTAEAQRQTPAAGNEPAVPCPAACSLAMVYSPKQEWQSLYPIDEAIRKGTLFAELDKPFLGRTLSGR